MEESYSESNAAATSSTVGVVIASGTAVNAAPAVMGGASGGNVLAGVYSMQAITVLPETDAYISSEVRDSIHNLKGSMMGFDFARPTRVENTFGYDKARNLDENQDEKFGIVKNGSSFVNLFGLMLVLLITIPLLNLIVMLLDKYVGQRIENKKNWFKVFIAKFKEFMFYHFYIKLMMLIYLILMFAAFPEIHDWIKGEDGKIFSRLFAVFVTLG